MDIIPAPKKNVILDASVFTTIQACGRLTDFRFNMDLVSILGKNNSLEAGSIVHKVLEYYYKAKIGGYERNQCISAGLAAGEMYVRSCPYCKDWASELVPPCGHEPNEFPGLQNTPMESDKKHIGWKWALESCEQYFEFWKGDFWVPLEVEVVKGKVLYEDELIRILWKAKLDLVMDTNENIYSVDTKTAKQRRDLLSLNNQFIGQALIMGTRGVVINKFGFQTSLKPEEKFTRELMSYSVDRLIEWQSEILPYWVYKYIQYVEDEYFPPNFTHCENKYGHCAFKEVCAANPSMRQEELQIHFMRGPKWDPKNLEID